MVRVLRFSAECHISFRLQLQYIFKEDSRLCHESRLSSSRQTSTIDTTLQDGVPCVRKRSRWFTNDRRRFGQGESVTVEALVTALGEAKFPAGNSYGHHHEANYSGDIDALCFIWVEATHPLLVRGKDVVHDLPACAHLTIKRFWSLPPLQRTIMEDAKREGEGRPRPYSCRVGR
jgi:hypothetical protein